MNGRAEQGAALPLALVFLAGLAIIAAAGYQAMSAASGTIRLVSASARLSAATMTAEEEATFAFLTLQPTERGLYSGPAFDAAAAALGDVDIDALDAGQFWRGDGERRMSALAAEDQPALFVDVEYRDGGAFAPLGQLDEEKSAALFRAFGLERETAARLAAKLADYQDEDFVRRFRGAERSDYRLFRRAPPTDSPLRVGEEIWRVLDAEKLLPPDIRSALLASATFHPLAGATKAAYAVGPVARYAVEIAADDSLEAVNVSDVTPSPLARLTIAAAGDETFGGISARRVVEIVRTPGFPDAPYQRRLIEERRGLFHPQQWEARDGVREIPSPAAADRQR